MSGLFGGFNSLVGSANSGMRRMLGSTMVTGVIVLIAIVYGNLFAPPLPGVVMQVFQHPIAKYIAWVLILFAFGQTLMSALLTALAFLIFDQILNMNQGLLQWGVDEAGQAIGAVERIGENTVGRAAEDTVEAVEGFMLGH